MKYDIALSFAGEDRKYVEEVANELQRMGVGVFYDKFETATLWGKDLYSHLQKVYQQEAKYTVIFISEHYAEKLWTNHERKMAQARAFEESEEYILPARFDDTEIEGITKTTGYIDLRQYSSKEFCNIICKKLGVEISTAEERSFVEAKDSVRDIEVDFGETFPFYESSEIDGVETRIWRIKVQNIGSRTLRLEVKVDFDSDKIPFVRMPLTRMHHEQESPIFDLYRGDKQLINLLTWYSNKPNEIHFSSTAVNYPKSVFKFDLDQKLSILIYVFGDTESYSKKFDIYVSESGLQIEKVSAEKKENVSEDISYSSGSIREMIKKSSSREMFKKSASRYK